MPWVVVTEARGESPPPASQIREIDEFVRRHAKPRFYADENFPPLATTILRKRGANVLTVQEARMCGHPDENVVSEARRLRRVLITCDRDYLNEERFPIMLSPVLVVCDFGSGRPDEIYQTLFCLWEIFTAPQFFDKWTKIDANREAWTQTTRFQDGSQMRRRFRVRHGNLEEWKE
jgi:hypothetical protein